MSNEEFLAMVSDKERKLTKEYSSLYENAEMYKRIDSNGKEFQDLDYLLSLNGGERFELRQIENMPSYARIGAMSEAEIADLRKQHYEFQSMTSEEIKTKLRNEIPNSYSYYQMINAAQQPVNGFSALQASIATYPEGARQLAGLMTEHSQLHDRMG